MELLHGKLPKLLASDIVFVRHKRGVFRAILRRITGSYWDHTALVLYPKNETKDRHFTVLVESIRPGIAALVGSRGVALHRLDKYLWDTRRYDVGVKRVPGLTKTERDRVRLFMLMNVDAPYWPWQYLQVTAAFFSKRIRRYVLSKQRFSCSSLIQKAFYDAMDWRKKPHVVFRKVVWSPIELMELTTPADIAHSDHAAWIYNKQQYDAR